jgi:hypothetical protein
MQQRRQAADPAAFPLPSAAVSQQLKVQAVTCHDNRLIQPPFTESQTVHEIQVALSHFFQCGQMRSKLLARVRVCA